MLISIPYVYEMRGRRGKLGRTVHASGTVEREIPELSSSDAPVVAEWTIDHGAHRSRASCRLVNGVHQIQIPGPLHVDMFGKDRIFSTGFGVRAISDLMKMVRGKTDTKVLEMLLIGETPEIGNFGKALDSVAASDEYFRRSSAEAFINSMVFIDGAAWTACNEPKLLATRSAIGREPTISISTDYDNRMHRKNYGPHSRSAFYGVEAFFNLSDYDDARTFLLECGEGAWLVNGSVEKVVVHSPEAFGFDGHELRLRAIGRTLYRLMQVNLGSMDTLAIQEWMALRDLSERPTPSDADTLEGLIERALPEIGSRKEAISLKADFEVALHLKPGRHTTYPVARPRPLV